MVGFIGGAWIQGLGGILICTGSSILVCCGPTNATVGAGKEMAAFVLMLIGAIVEVIGAIVGVILFFAWAATLRETCETSWGFIPGAAGEAAVTDCVNTSTGFLALIIWPVVAFGIITGILSLVAAIMAKMGHASMKGGGV